MVQETTAVGIVIHGPTGGVYHAAWLGFFRRNFPQLLHAQCVALRVFAGIELVVRDQLLTQVAARALGEDRVFTEQRHTQLEIASCHAVFADAHVAGSDTRYGTGIVIQNMRRSEARKDLNAQCFGLFAEPFRDSAQADHVTTVVVKAARNQSVRRALGASF